MCLLVSIVLYAAASQLHAVWISCAAIFVNMLASSLVPTGCPVTNDPYVVVRDQGQ
jgi:hypothetical protein